MDSSHSFRVEINKLDIQGEYLTGKSIPANTMQTVEDVVLKWPLRINREVR